MDDDSHIRRPDAEVGGREPDRAREGNATAANRLAFMRSNRLAQATMMLQQAIDVNRSTIAHLNVARRDLAAAEEVQGGIVDALQRDRDRERERQKNLKQAERHAVTAREKLAEYLRKLAKDKLFMALMIVAIVGVGIVAAVVVRDSLVSAAAVGGAAAAAGNSGSTTAVVPPPTAVPTVPFTTAASAPPLPTVVSASPSRVAADNRSLAITVMPSLIAVSDTG